jgi:hypothetical protein
MPKVVEPCVRTSPGGVTESRVNDLLLSLCCDKKDTEFRIPLPLRSACLLTTYLLYAETKFNMLK